MRLELLGQQNYSIAWSAQEHWADKFHYLLLLLLLILLVLLLLLLLLLLLWSMNRMFRHIFKTDIVILLLSNRAWFMIVLLLAPRLAAQTCKA